MNTPRGFFLAAAVWTMAAVLGWCVVAVIAAPWVLR